MALLGRMQRLCRLMSRRKPAKPWGDEARTRDSLMRNVLSLTDLTLLGIGATLGTGRIGLGPLPPPLPFPT